MKDCTVTPTWRELPSLTSQPCDELSVDLFDMSENTPLIGTLNDGNRAGVESRNGAIARSSDDVVRRPFERECIVWGFLMGFFVAATAVVYANTYCVRVHELLKEHNVLFYAFPYGICATVLLCAGLLPLPTRVRTRWMWSLVELCILIIVALLWGIAVGLSGVALGLPSIVFISLPLLSLFAMMQFSSALTFYLEGRRVAHRDTRAIGHQQF